MARRRYYLEDIALGEAWRRFEQALTEFGGVRPLEGEPVSITEARGRVTAEPVWAAISSPHYHAAAMDGIAVRASDTFAATEREPVRLRLPEQAIWVDTGDPLPPDRDAVIMAEHVQPLGEDEVEILAAVHPWQHVRPLGEDMVATELVLPVNHRIRPVGLGALAASGRVLLQLRRRPKVAIIPTGTELVPPGTDLKPGDIVEFNSLMIGGSIEEWGGLPERKQIVPDQPSALRAALSDALETNDIVVINAGSSAGSEDYTAAVIGELGRVVVHGVAIRPGHPVILGIARDKPIIGLPGYPVSTMLTAELFLRPLIYRLQGLVAPERPLVEAVMSRKVLSPIGEDEYLRVTLGRVGGRIVAAPLTRGAGVVTSLVRADGIARLPRFSEGVHAGANVQVELLRLIEEIERTIVAIGSHDLALDLLASFLQRDAPGARLTSANAGSYGGLVALKRGEAHLAGSHLLDEETGDYNFPFIRRLIPELEVVVLNLTFRDQGLIVQPGNPKGIRSLQDLTRPDVRFVNRQKGSGTRVVLDYELRQQELDAGGIAGYGREEFTHMAVAAAVMSGAAHVGLGIMAAARALGLEFIPLLRERYDLVIPRVYYESPLLQPLLKIIRGEEYRNAVAALGGYGVEMMGQVMQGSRAGEEGGRSLGT
ncbi:MAG: molybdopterin biosynthesis protein [Dehalococcoidia bacterium]